MYESATSIGDSAFTPSPTLDVTDGRVDADFLGGTTHHAFLLANLGHVAEGGTFPRNPRLPEDVAVTVL
jgi:hypothetical protein